MMLRHFINALLVAAASASLWSCAGEDLDSGTTGEGNVTLTFSSARTGSRAADDANNEDAINSLHIFLYPTSATDDTPATVFQAFTGLTAKQRTTVKMSVELDDMAALIGHDLTTAGTCRMVAVANLPAGVSLNANATVNELRAQTVTANFGTQKVQTGFVMIGDTNETDRAGNTAVTFTPDGKGSGTGSGNVMLVRAAARISLALSVPEQIVMPEGSANAGTWTPVPDGMQVLLNNGVSRSAIDPSRVSITLADGDYFRIGTSADADRRYGFTNSEGMVGGSAYPWKMTVPFYSYPNSWQKIATEQHRTSMTLIVPFRKNQETEYQTCYYSVPIVKDPDAGSNTYSLRRNTAYQVNINLDMLGSFSPQEPLPVEASYQAVDWAEAPTTADIKDYRYLVVNQKEYVVDNQPSISIPFYTSHTVEISDITMSYKRFNAVSRGNGEVVDIKVTKAQNKLSGEKNTDNDNDSIFSYRLDKDATGNNVLVIEHKLVPWTPRQSNGDEIRENQAYSSVSAAQTALNAAAYYTPTTGTAYSPYTFSVTIKHKDQTDPNTPWQETLTITQYPGMWILADRNNGGSGNGSVDGRTFLNYGPYMTWSYDREQTGGPLWKPEYTYVWNSNQINATNDWTGNLGGLHGLTGENKNPNMYVITINTLSSDTKYIIDDPRTLFSENNLDAEGALPNSTSNGNPAPNSIDDYTQTGNGNNLWRRAGWCAKAPALYPTGGPNRSLTYYYPTNESETNKMVVAPKIRIASSYGVCTTGRSRTEARRRCATYQEQGRPAGRWRIPTLGEMQFIVNLSQTNRIPTLFTKGAHYYCAQGQVNIPYSNGEVTLTTTTGLKEMTVRCVYDEWYWEKQTDYTITPTTGYRLGDMPKQNPEEGIK